MTLSKQNQALHELALKLSREFRQAETALIDVIARVECERLFQRLGRASLFEYVVKDLGHTESVAALSNENAAELVEFASAHTSFEIDREVARRSPGARQRTRVSQVSGELVPISLTLPREV